MIVESAANDEEAINKVKSNGTGYYDCILMDIVMPGIDGYETAYSIRELHSKIKLPIIALNLGTIHGALLRMNRSIQAEDVYGIVKWDRSYTRAYRRGIESVLLEFYLIFCGFNLYKYHNKRINRLTESA